MSKLILMRFLAQLCILEKTEVLWQDSFKLHTNITCPDQCIALNCNIVVQGVSAPKKQKWGSSLTTRSSPVLAERTFQSHLATYDTQMGPENKMFVGCFWWSSPFPGNRRCGFDFSHFCPKRLLPFSLWKFNYWAMRNEGGWPQKGQSTGLLLHASLSEDPSGLDSEVRQARVRSPPHEWEQARWQLQDVGLSCLPLHYKSFRTKGTSTRRCTWRVRVPSIGLEDQVNTFCGFEPMYASFFQFLDLQIDVCISSQWKWIPHNYVRWIPNLNYCFL